MNTATASTASLPFELGEATSHAGLTIVPLFPLDQPRLEYIGLDEALARGLTVTEATESGAVERLLVENPLADRVLLYEGEELVGAKQNRIIRTTTLVEAKSTLDLSVLCVERGRWAYRSRRFAAAPRAAFPTARRTGRRAGQAAVWASIHASMAELDAVSPTEAQEAMYERHAPSLDNFVAALPRLPSQAGVLVGIGGQLVCLDYVSRPDVFAGLYPKLLRGYALEALGQPEGKLRPREVASFLRRLERAERRVSQPTGAGTERRLVGEVLGSELAAHGEVIALGAFPAAAA